MHAEQPQPGRLATLSQISRAVSATLDLRTLYDTMYEQIGHVMDASQFLIALKQPRGDSILIPYLQEEGSLLTDLELPYTDSTTSVIISTGKPLLYGSPDEYYRYQEEHGLTHYIVGEEDSTSGIFVPLNTGNRTIGALSVQSKRLHAYSWDDVQTLMVISSQAAIAIENARLYEQSQASVEQMQVLLHVARTINESLELRDVLDSILLSMRGVMPYAFAAILLPDPSAGTLDIVRSISAHVDNPEGDPLVTLKIPLGQGISGAVFDSGAPLIVSDVREFPGFIDHELEGVFSEMAVPLKRGDSIVGVLDVGRKGVGAFSVDEVDLLSLFASQAAIAIENARLFTNQRRRVEELQTLQSLVRRLMPLHDPAEIVSTVNAELKQLIDYHACRLYLLDDESHTLRPLNESDGESPSVPIALDRGFAGWIVRTGRADAIPNTLHDIRPVQLPGTPRREESLVGAPLSYEDRVRGAIVLSRLGTHQFDENALRLLEIIAAQVAIAFDRARLYQELRTDAITDPLVQLWNRRYLLERYREERLRAARTERPLVALMLDIDKFKQVNDTFGHDAGDVVLKELAQLLRTQMREEDIVCRYGGEEFCILLPETPLDEATQIAERLRAVTEMYRMPPEAGVSSVKFSVGVAGWESSDAGEDLFSRADAAMYRVKAHGGNGVCIAGQGDFRMCDSGSVG